MRDVLLPTAENCLEMARQELIKKDLILQTEYESRRTIVAVFEVPSHESREHIHAFFLKYGEILGVTSDYLSGGWNFDIILD